MRWIIAILLGCTACLPAANVTLAELDAAERERVCRVAAHEKGSCENGQDYERYTRGQCEAQLSRLEGTDCPVTVEDLDALTYDPCSDEAARVRELASTCDALFD